MKKLMIVVIVSLALLMPLFAMGEDSKDTKEVLTLKRDLVQERVMRIQAQLSLIQQQFTEGQKYLQETQKELKELDAKLKAMEPKPEVGSKPEPKELKIPKEPKPEPRKEK